jgi:hypothetical protein
MDQYNDKSPTDDTSVEGGRQSEERLESKLLEGLDSGPMIDVTKEHIATTRAELIERIRSNKTRNG